LKRGRIELEAIPLGTSRTEEMFWKWKTVRKDESCETQFVDGRCQISLREGAKRWERRGSRRLRK
jgi:hypothetical protein